MWLFLLLPSTALLCQAALEMQLYLCTPKTLQKIGMSTYAHCVGDTHVVHAGTQTQSPRSALCVLPVKNSAESVIVPRRATDR